MTVEHTPGPWIVALDEPYDAQRPTHYLEDQAGHQLMLLARLPEVGPEQHVSNLKLIAAAPELLAACDAALWLMQRVVEWDGAGEPITKFAADRHAEDFRAAIAKATGGAS
jgi:hypothetical protein